MEIDFLEKTIFESFLETILDSAVPGKMSAPLKIVV
jgi:hypothetical protein